MSTIKQKLSYKKITIWTLVLSVGFISGYITLLIITPNNAQTVIDETTTAETLEQQTSQQESTQTQPVEQMDDDTEPSINDDQSVVAPAVQDPYDEDIYIYPPFQPLENSQPEPDTTPDNDV